MPSFIVPRKSGAHRLASIALFRTLLSQCKAVPLPNEQQCQLQNLVRHRFRKNRDLQSHRYLKLVFIAGYEAVDLLDASASGDLKSILKLRSLMERTPLSLKPPRPPAPKLPRRGPDCEGPPPGKKFIDVHPLTQNIRRIPHLVCTNGLPFIRYNKPEPEVVRRLLRSRIHQRQSRQTLQENLEDYLLPLSHLEDKWDEIVSRECGNNDESRREVNLWATVPTEAIKMVSFLKNAERNRAYEMGLKMQEIVDVETEVVRKEKIEQRYWRRREKKKR